jgi:uncharacterized protein YukE
MASRDIYALAQADARIDAAQESVRAAMQGYVAVRADEKWDQQTTALYELLSTANNALSQASQEVNRLLDEVIDG